MLDRTTSDGSGRFLLEFRGKMAREMEFVDVCVLSSSGARIGAERVRMLELDSPGVLLFQAAQTMPVAASAEPGGPIVRFLANGEPSLLVESSCMNTTLEWAVNALESAELHVSLLADGRPIASGLPAVGSYSVDGSGTSVYTLAVRTSSGSGSSSHSKRLIVKRFPTLALCFESTTLHRNGPISVGLMISCPAPKEGLRVRLVSSDPQKVTGGDALIPAGGKWATVGLVAGDEAGDVEVTGIAAGYLRDAVRITIT